MKTIIPAAFAALLLVSTSMSAASDKFDITSPDGHLSMSVTSGAQITYSLSRDGQLLLDSCPVSMQFADGRSFDGSARLKKTSRRHVESEIVPVIYTKNCVRDNFNELTMSYKDFQLVFRVYDDGAAYRFVSALKGDYIVKDEPVKFNFAGDWKAYLPYSTRKGDYEKQVNSNYQAVYDRDKLTEWKDGKIAFLPFLVEAPQGVRICITEADLFSYPGMFVANPDKDTSVESVYQHYPAEFVEQEGRLVNNITRYEDYIAKCSGPREFPWRVIAVSPDDIGMADNDLVYKLARPADPSRDYSWVVPGKVAWDWWNDWNLYGVDFRAGINNETYEYYIDFASKNGVKYVILDEGWSVPGEGDLLKVIPEIDIRRLVDYGAERGVGIILWAGYAAFERDMEKVCEKYSKMGVKGFKVDFMNRADQKIVEFYEKGARLTDKYGLLIDYHGAYKPTGLQRTFPNAINYEGIYGLEENKWKARSTAMDQVEYDVTVPFIRFVAGPADYTQGAMNNAIRKNYHPCYNEPMSMGTRCHQMAEYVIFYSPVNMLCDSPSNYMKEQECTTFITAVPEVWDETVGLEGKIAEHLSIARRKGDVWYVASLNDWTARDITLDLNFLPEGEYVMETFRDGINADRAARDYKHVVEDLPASRKVQLHMAPGGGWITKITKK